MIPVEEAIARCLALAAPLGPERVPLAKAAGRWMCAPAVATRFVEAPKLNTAPMADAPVIRPRLRDRLSRPDTTPRWSAVALAITAVLFADWKLA